MKTRKIPTHDSLGKIPTALELLMELETIDRVRKVAR